VLVGKSAVNLRVQFSRISKFGAALQAKTKFFRAFDYAMANKELYAAVNPIVYRPSSIARPWCEASPPICHGVSDFVSLAVQASS
jgi:hypothetical protein